MLKISKSRAPSCLETLAETPGADWGSVREVQKSELRRALLAEQGGLCAYCMRRIRDTRDARGHPTMKVEHWSARSGGANPFRWADLLGVCMGRSGKVEHCDTARGNRPLEVHPARDEVERIVRYLGDGAVEIDRPLANGKTKARGCQADVETLNLNAPPLKAERRIIVDAVLARASRADATELRRMLGLWEGRDESGNRPENAGVALYLLRRALAQREARSKRIRRVPRPG